jgi:hypothetical protein
VAKRVGETMAPLQLRKELPNPNRRRLWLLPFLIAAQVALKVLVIDRVITADSWKGDRNGEYDLETQQCGALSCMCL